MCHLQNNLGFSDLTWETGWGRLHHRITSKIFKPEPGGCFLKVPPPYISPCPCLHSPMVSPPGPLPLLHQTDSNLSTLIRQSNSMLLALYIITTTIRSSWPWPTLLCSTAQLSKDSALQSSQRPSGFLFLQLRKPQERGGQDTECEGRACRGRQRGHPSCLLVCSADQGPPVTEDICSESSNSLSSFFYYGR